MSSPQIWNIEQEKDREKEKVGGRPAKLNEKKGDRDLKREIKNKVSRRSREKQRQRNVQKKCAFLLIRPIVVFHRSPALPSPLSITRFYIFFERTINIIESLAFSPG